MLYSAGKNDIIFLDIETTGLNPWFGDKVTCICAKTLDNQRIFRECSNDEFKLLNNFDDWINQQSDYDLLVHANGKEFDIPFLCARMLLLGFSPSWSVRLLTHMRQFDLCTDITYGEYGKISLNKLAKIYNVPQKTAKGTDAIKWFKQSEYQKIEDYCYSDVLVTEAVYLKFLELNNRGVESENKNPAS